MERNMVLAVIFSAAAVVRLCEILGCTVMKL